MGNKGTSDSQGAIAQRIKQLLNEKGLSRKEMAADLKVTTETLNSWASRGAIKRDHLIPFSRYVGCTVDELLTGEAPGKNTLTYNKDEIAPGLKQRHHPIPLLETTDLMAVTEKHEMTDDEDDATRLWMHETAETWINNPTQMTELYIPYLTGHQHDEEIPGTPRYAVQISQPDHDSPDAPWTWQGRLLAMATDIWPSRDELSMFVRRPFHDDGAAGLWSLHAGFFRADAWTVPKDADQWWHHAARHKVDRYFTLHVQQGVNSSDDTVIHFKRHQWCYLGVCVFTMGWTGGVRSMVNTRLLDRKVAASRRRIRSETGQPFLD